MRVSWLALALPLLAEANTHGHRGHHDHKVVHKAFDDVSNQVKDSDLAGDVQRAEEIVARSTSSEVDPPYWLANIKHQGHAAFNPEASNYSVFRNVMDYGAVGDGVTDDTDAINAAIRDGGRLGPGSGKGSTTTPAIVYFPAGTYLVSTPIIDFYFTQLIGNPNAMPTLKATANFTGLGVIDGDEYQSSGNTGWLPANTFYRQIRNFKIDLTGIAGTTAATAIHWPTAQATSIQNVVIAMSAEAGTQHQGIFLESGSGGFMNDITITGGLYGMNLGSQQFTMRNIRISNAVTAISQIWNWGWTYQGLVLSNCQTGVSISNGAPVAQSVGSVNIIDSTIKDCSAFVTTAWESSKFTNGSLILENISLVNTPVAVNGTTGTILEGGSSSISAWGQGHKYTPSGVVNFQGAFTAPTRPSGLLASDGSAYYTRSKPQYAAAPVSSIVSIRDAGAKGDGITDDTVAIQQALDSAAGTGHIVFFDQGTYKVTSPITIPPNSRVVGEAYSVIMASGPTWSDITKPVAVVKVGKAGQSGHVEWSDMLVSAQGSTPGAVLIEWNLKANAGSGMWDVHTRIGGSIGSELNLAQCPHTAQLTPKCEAVYMSMHITASASGVYMENVWLWTADHDIDTSKNPRISVYSGRGLLVQGKNHWMYATAVEHHSLYQYQIVNAQSIVAGFIQTETPYYQPNPNAINSPYPLNPALHDPDYSSSCPAKGNCDALGLRILDSSDIIIYGAGLYSFFNNYRTHCSTFPTPENCQSQIFSIEGTTSALTVYTLSTVGTNNMIVHSGKILATIQANLDTYASTIAYFAL